MTIRIPVHGTYEEIIQSSRVSCIESESHAFQCNLTLSHSHKYFSRISALLELGNTIVLDVRNAYNHKIPSFTGTELNKLVCFWQYQEVQNSKIF